MGNQDSLSNLSNWADIEMQKLWRRDSISTWPCSVSEAPLLSIRRTLRTRWGCLWHSTSWFMFSTGRKTGPLEDLPFSVANKFFVCFKAVRTTLLNDLLLQLTLASWRVCRHYDELLFPGFLGVTFLFTAIIIKSLWLKKFGVLIYAIGIVSLLEQLDGRSIS